MNSRRLGSSPRRLTPIERYDLTSGTPLLNSGSPLAQEAAPFHTGFLAAEQFNHAHRDVDISPVSSNDPTHEPVSYTGRQKSSPRGSNKKKRTSTQYAPTDETSIDQTSSASTHYEVFETKEQQEASCDAIPSIFPPFSPTHQQHKESSSIRQRDNHRRQHRKHTNNQGRSTTHKRSRRSSRRQHHHRRSFDQTVEECDDSSLGECRSASVRKADRCAAGTLNLGERLGACMVVSVDAYRHQCLHTYDSYEETKEQTFPMHCRDGLKSRDITNNKGYGDQNSVVEDEVVPPEEVDSRYKLKSHADDISEPSFLPLVTPEEQEQQPNQQHDQQHQQHQQQEQSTSMDVLNSNVMCIKTKKTASKGENTMRDFRLNRLFRCEADTAVVPQARFLSELATQDETIQQLKAQLQQAKSQLAQQKQEGSENNVSLRTEVVFLRSQLAEAKAELLTISNKEATIKELQQQVQTLREEPSRKGDSVDTTKTDKELGAEDANVIVDNATNDKELMEANARIADLSKKAAEDEKLFLEVKKAMSQELEKTRDELSRSRNQLFDLKLTLAQAESRAERAEHAASEHQSTVKNEDPQNDEDSKGDTKDELQPVEALEKSLELEEANQEIIRLNLQLAKATAQNEAQSADFGELEALRSTKTELQEELSRLLHHKGEQDALLEYESVRYGNREKLLEEKCQQLQQQLESQLARGVEVEEKNADELANLRDRLTKSELELECERSRLQLRESEFQEQCQRLQEDFRSQMHAETSKIISRELAALQEQVKGAELEIERLRSQVSEAEANEQAFDLAFRSLEGKLWEVQNKYARQKDLCSQVANHYIRRLSQQNQSLQHGETQRKEMEDRYHRLKEELDSARHYSVRNKAEVSKSHVELELTTRELAILRQERDGLKLTVRDLSSQCKNLEHQHLSSLESSEQNAAEVLRVKKELNLLVAEVAATKQSAREAERKCTELQRTTSVLERERDSSLADLVKLQAKYRLQLAVCSTASNLYITHYSQVQRDLGCYVKTSAELKETCQQQEEEIKLVNNRNMELNRMCQKQEEKNRVLLSIKSDLQTTCQEQQEEIKNILSSKSELQTMCLKHQENIKCLSEVETKCQNLEEEIRCLLTNNTKWEDSYRELEGETASLLSGKGMLEEKCKRQEEEIRLLVRDKVELETRCRQQEEAKCHARKQTTLVEDQCQKQEGEIKCLLINKTELETKCQKLEEEIRCLLSSKSEQEDMYKAEMKGLQSSKSILEKQCDKQEEEIKCLVRDKAEVETRFQRQQEEAKCLARNQTTLVEDQCQQQKEEIKCLFMSKTELETKCQKLEEDIRCLLSKKTKWEDSYRELEGEKKGLLRSKSMLEKKCEKLEEEIQCLGRDKAEVETKCQRQQEDAKYLERNLNALVEDQCQKQEGEIKRLETNCKIQEEEIKGLLINKSELEMKCRNQEEEINFLLHNKTELETKCQQLEEEVKLQLSITREQSEKSQDVMSKARAHLETVETSLKTLTKEAQSKKEAADKDRQTLERSISELRLKTSFQLDLLATAADYHSRQHASASHNNSELQATCRTLEEELKSRATVAKESSENNKNAAKRVRKELARVEVEAQGLKELALEAESKWRQSEINQERAKKERDTTILELKKCRLKFGMQLELLSRVADYCSRQKTLAHDALSQTAGELENTKHLLRDVRRVAIVSELEAFYQLKRMKKDVEETVVEQDSLYFSFNNTQLDPYVNDDSFRTCESQSLSERRSSIESSRTSTERRASIESFRTCLISSDQRASVESFKTCVAFADRRASIKPLHNIRSEEQCVPKRKTFAKQLDNFWREVRSLSPHPQQALSVSPLLPVSPARSENTIDSMTSPRQFETPNQNKAEQLKRQLRRKELEMNERFQKHTKQRNGLSNELEKTRDQLRHCQAQLEELRQEVELSKRKPEAKAREEIRVLRSLIQESERASEKAHQQLLASQQREHDLIDEVEELNTTNLRHQETILSFRRELEEILLLLQETKARWREDAERFEVDLKQRSEKEAKLEAEIEALKGSLEQANGMKKLLPPLTPSVDFDSHVAGKTTRDKDAHSVSNLKDVHSGTNLIWGSLSPVGTVGSCPHDEPPISKLMFKTSYSKTPQRDNRSSYNAAVEEILADDCSFIGVIDATKPPSDCNASVSSITCGKTNSDISLCMPTLHDPSATLPRPQDGRSIAPQRTEESPSNVSESSVLSPPIISAAAVLSHLPEPVPVRIHPPASAVDRVAATLKSYMSRKRGDSS